VELLKRLVARSEALIEGFRPGVMERLGLGPEDLKSLNPDLVYGRMTGWGQSGPRAQTAGHDLNYISVSGAAWYSANPGEPPFAPPTLVGDIGGGALYLAVGVLSGVLAARAGRGGCVVDAAIVDGSAHMMNLLMALRSRRRHVDAARQEACLTDRTGAAATPAPTAVSSPCSAWSRNSTLSS
jgi:alpha-methylacyl-CoA racemase